MKIIEKSYHLILKYKYAKINSYLAYSITNTSKHLKFHKQSGQFKIFN